MTTTFQILLIIPHLTHCLQVKNFHWCVIFFDNTLLVHLEMFCFTKVHQKQQHTIIPLF